MGSTLVNRINKKDNTIINITLFFIVWSFFHGFPYLFRGFTQVILGGRLNFILVLAQSFLFIAMMVNNPRCFNKLNQKHVTLYVAVLMFIYFVCAISVTVFDNSLIFSAIGISYLLFLRDDLKLVCFERFINLLTTLLFFSIIEYFVFIFTHSGVVLFTNIVIGDEDVALPQYYNQYLFNIINQTNEFPRFQSVCTEPGDVGTLCGLLLFAFQQKNKSKRQLIQYLIVIVSGVLSFSLAFYTMLAIVLISGRRKSGIMVFYLLIALAVYVYLWEFFEYRIIFRLGEENIDNRVTDVFNRMFYQALSDGSLFFPHERGDSFGAGIKVWLWRYGIISFLPLFYCYYHYFKIKVKQNDSVRWLCWLFFISFWISFYQRQWIMNLEYMIVFLSIPIIFSKNHNKTFAIANN